MEGVPREMNLGTIGARFCRSALFFRRSEDTDHRVKQAVKRLVVQVADLRYEQLLIGREQLAGPGIADDAERAPRSRNWRALRPSRRHTGCWSPGTESSRRDRHRRERRQDAVCSGRGRKTGKEPVLPSRLKVRPRGVLFGAIPVLGKGRFAE